MTAIGCAFRYCVADTFLVWSQVCPFYLTKHMLPESEIVFVPYNYLIDPLARRSIGMSIENSVLIFDEAHNVVRLRW